MIKKYKLKKDRFEHSAGTVVYEQIKHDYGLSSDDTRHTGVQHITVTLKENGDYPGFTVPVHELGETS